MSVIRSIAAFACLVAVLPCVPQPLAAQVTPSASPATDVARDLVARLELSRYKEAIQGLTRFGDRRQGTDRNRAAIDWIADQLRAHGCAPERMQYEYTGQQLRSPASVSATVPAVPARPAVSPRATPPQKGYRGPTGVNTRPDVQTDSALRTINAQPDTPGTREQVYCTKVGTLRPDEMYIVSAHMDGHGFGEAANDDASGSAIVLELARVLNAPGVTSERSIRFILWNNEETGLNGSRAYVATRGPMQGQESPDSSGRYPEPRWLGVIQHDMMLFDHGMPDSTGGVRPVQRAEADVNIEFAGGSTMAAESQRLAWLLRAANDRYATEYPAAVGDRMSNTDSAPFADLAPAISLRENERLSQIGRGWDPHWHQPTDVFRTFSDADFRLGLNAAQTTLAALVQLAGITVSVP
ncbi:MAG: M20/M25/M40 family metallo-hydrolase [Gemmatimonadales bacterium]